MGKYIAFIWCLLQKGKICNFYGYSTTNWTIYVIYRLSTPRARRAKKLHLYGAISKKANTFHIYENKGFYAINLMPVPKGPNCFIYMVPDPKGPKYSIYTETTITGPKYTKYMVPTHYGWNIPYLCVLSLKRAKNVIYIASTPKSGEICHSYDAFSKGNLICPFYVAYRKRAKFCHGNRDAWCVIL